MVQLSSRKTSTTRTRSIARDYNPRYQLFFIWVILVLTHLQPLSAHHHHHHQHLQSSSYVSSSRKAMLFKSTTKLHEFFHATVSPPISAPGPEGSVFDQDKRIIHTGPNPLHN